MELDDDWESKFREEVLFTQPGIILKKLDYDAGFKCLILETREKMLYRTNWQLDDLGNGNLLPRIQ